MSRLRSSRHSLWRPAHLARHSLLPLVMAASTAACVDPTPTYTAPVQSPPIILGNLVDPPTFRVIRIALGTKQPLEVPFRSIDAGESLTAIFWLDYDPSQSQTKIDLQNIHQQGIFADSRPLDEQLDRKITFDWEASPAGCHTVTMALSHESNYPIRPEAGIYIPGHLPPVDQNAIAQVTWFFDVQDASADSNPKPICWGIQ